MLSKIAQALLVAGSAALAAPALAQDAAMESPPELAEASTGLEAATTLGLIETLASGEAYTAFIPSNDALTAVQGEETSALMADTTAFTSLVQGYVIAGNVMAADAMTLVTDGGGTATVDSLAGTPITLAMEGDALTVNGQAVGTPDLMLGNVTIHILDGAFLPGDTES